jgi:hypothetical protein
LGNPLATNFFFNNFTNSQEQVLLEDLIIESIKIYGLDMFYLPRNTGLVDGIWSEDARRSYTTAIPVELYIKNVEGFEGEGDFLSKFNLQIRDQITFTIARRTFSNEVVSSDAAAGDAARERPQEGDLIYFPLNKKIFEIRFVEHESIFYQLGSLQVYDLKCELFEYSNEYFDTRIAAVDRLMENYSLGLERDGILTEDGFLLTDEQGYPLVQEDYDINVADPSAQNDDFETVADSIIDFTERDPFSEGTY